MGDLNRGKKGSNECGIKSTRLEESQCLRY